MRLFRYGVAPLIAAACLIMPTRSAALQLPDGRIKTCSLPNGRVWQERFIAGPVGFFAGVTQVTPFGAVTTWDVAQINNLTNMAQNLALRLFGSGNPSIAHDRSLVIEQLVFHECAHARLPTSNEFVANAESIRQMQALGEISSVADLQWLGAFTQSIGPQPVQYGGSGAAFWQGTLATLNQAPAQLPLDSAPL